MKASRPFLPPLTKVVRLGQKIIYLRFQGFHIFISTWAKELIADVRNPTGHGLSPMYCSDMGYDGLCLTQEFTDRMVASDIKLHDLKVGRFG